MGSVGRELNLIASEFVKQYYTLLNKAPHFIHIFYNHDSSLIYGTVEMGSDNHTDPVVGREKIAALIQELKLNDCRASIKQIDCLATLAGGLVLQVIGELSNDGKPMRRFLQTFVLAPSPDQTRFDGDPHTQNRANDNRRGVQFSESNPNSSHNQKFYVLNSIFRYQDDGPESEFEDDSVGAKTNTSADSGVEHSEGVALATKTGSAAHPQVQQPQPQPQQQQQKVVTSVEQPTNSPKSSEPATSLEQLKRNDVKVVTTNGTDNPVRKSEMSEKPSTENGKVVPSDSQMQPTPVPTNNAVETSAAITVANQSSSSSAQAPASTTAAPAPRQSNEPKTWANMVRNTMPPSSTSSPVSAGVATTKEQPSLNQLNQAQNPSQQQQIPHHHHQQQPRQQQSSLSQNEQQQNNTNPINNSNNTINSNSRRRHMIRKTSNNKTGNGNGIGSSGGGNGNGTGGGAGGGRTIKNRPPRPPTIATPTTKPAV